MNIIEEFKKGCSNHEFLLEQLKNDQAGKMQQIVSSQATKYVSERTMRHHMSLHKSSQYYVTRMELQVHGRQQRDIIHCDQHVLHMSS